MLKRLTLKQLLIASIVVVVLFLLSFIVKPTSPTPVLTASSPAQNAQDIRPTDQIILQFDIPIDISLLNITSEPIEEWSLQKGRNDSTVIVKSKLYFHAATKYTVSMQYANKPLPPLEFKTLTQQGDPRYTRQVIAQMEVDYPLSTKFPYTTNAYRVVYSAPLTLEITPKNSVFTEEEMINQVRDFVKTNGADPNTHQYRVVNPSPSP